MKKRAASQMLWIIVTAVIAILILVVYSYMTGGIVKRVAEVLFRNADDTELRLNCSVIPRTGGDTDGDGIRDDLPQCQKYKETKP